jgi:hypothetical protein
MMLQNRLLSLSIVLAIASVPLDATISSNVPVLVAAINREKQTPVIDFRNQGTLAQQYQTLGSLLQSPAVLNPTPQRKKLDQEVDNCYLLKDHNERVFEAYDRQLPHFEAELCSSEDLQQMFGSHERFKQFFEAFLVLHDSGKPVGPLANQHENTLPLMQAYLQKWEFNESQRMLATALINNDIFGDMAQKGLTVGKAHALIVQEATEIPLHQKTLYTLHHLFWACDAGSYKSLQEVIVTSADGRYVPLYEQKRVRILKNLCSTHSPSY